MFKIDPTQKFDFDNENNLVTYGGLKVKGSWELTEDHDLAFTVKADKASEENTKIVFGGLIKDISHRLNLG